MDEQRGESGCDVCSPAISLAGVGTRVHVRESVAIGVRKENSISKPAAWEVEFAGGNAVGHPLADVI